MPQSISPSRGRLHGLDTLRAIAILSVMTFHEFGWWDQLPRIVERAARLGWMGVDLFFVLSGYLIGSQLFRPYLSGQIPQLWPFYRKRLYRVLPAYLVVLTLYFAWPLWREDPGISPLWQFLTFTENFFVDYSVNHAFSHVWSLCVEEHFYLVLPILVLWCMRRPSLRKTVALVAFVLLLGIGTRGYALVHDLQPLDRAGHSFSLAYIENIYYPTWNRLDGLLMGVVLALIQLFRPNWWRTVQHRGHTLLFAGLALTGIAIVLFQNRFESATGIEAVGTVLGFPILSLGLALLVASALSTNGFFSRVRVPGAKITATLAFSLYLTHKAVINLDSHYLPALAKSPSWGWLAWMLVTCFSAAGLLYLLVERPFLLLRDRSGRL